MLRNRPRFLLFLLVAGALTNVLVTSWLAYRQRATSLNIAEIWDEDAQSILMSESGELAFVASNFGVDVVYWAPNSEGVPLQESERHRYRSRPLWLWPYRAIAPNSDSIHTDLVIAVGWPFRCAIGWRRESLTSEGRVSTDFCLKWVRRPVTERDIPSARQVAAGRKVAVLAPYFPEPVGMVANSAVFALGWWFVAAVPISLFRNSRRKRGRCVQCGFDLCGNVTKRCPECGRDNPSG